MTRSGGLPKAIIDRALTPRVGRVLEKAARAGAATTILDLNTFGARWMARSALEPFDPTAN